MSNVITSSVGLDYLQFTYFPVSVDVTEGIEDGLNTSLMACFKRDFWELFSSSKCPVNDLGYGRYGYDCGISWSDHFFAYWSTDRDDMGVHVQINGSGLIDFYNTLNHKKESVIDAVEFLRSINSRGRIKFSRLDLNFDDEKKLLYPRDLYQAWEENRISTLCHYCRFDSLHNADGENGTTFYLGKSTGDKMLRVYDKYVESKHDINAIRWEMQLRHRTADKIVHDILDNGISGDYFKGLIFGFLKVYCECIVNDLGLKEKHFAREIDLLDEFERVFDPIVRETQVLRIKTYDHKHDEDRTNEWYRSTVVPGFSRYAQKVGIEYALDQIDFDDPEFWLRMDRYSQARYLAKVSGKKYVL